MKNWSQTIYRFSVNDRKNGHGDWHLNIVWMVTLYCFYLILIIILLLRLMLLEVIIFILNIRINTCLEKVETYLALFTFIYRDHFEQVGEGVIIRSFGEQFYGKTRTTKNRSKFMMLVPTWGTLCGKPSINVHSNIGGTTDLFYHTEVQVIINTLFV